MHNNKHKFIECGCCGHYHPIDFWGDCRDDSNRFHIVQLEEMGYSFDDILELDEQEED
jgi:hypothetical protein